jgi:hypothetical protein
MTRIAIPAVVTLLSVVSLIGASGWNRSGNPRLRITLTERELPLTRIPGERHPGVQLRIEYQPRRDPLDARNWLTEERLRRLGFAFTIMPGAPEAADTYSRALPNIAWAAFEYDGPVWRDIERRQALEPETPERRYPIKSRLVPVDASLDADTLLARYPSGHLVLRASIDLGYIGPKEKGPLVYGYIRNLIPPHITVPHQLQDRFTALANVNDTPRYEVDLALGRLRIPYVTDVRNTKARK